MNLYDFSQVNNNEMGIYITKAEDAQLYEDIYKEAMRLVRASTDVNISVTEVPKIEQKIKTYRKMSNNTGFCIRCGAEIALDPTHPYCNDCFKEWKRYSNEDYPEKYCHICKKENRSTIIKPTCFECYKINKTKLEFPLAKA